MAICDGKSIKDYIAIEGGEFVGKSELTARLQEVFGSAVFFREPGGTPTGEKLRQLLKEEITDPIASVFGFIVQRRLVTNQLRTMDLNNRLVITDRSLLTSVVYQSLMSEATNLNPLGMERIYQLNLAADLIVPNKVIYLTVNETALAKRVAERGEETDILGTYASANRKEVNERYLNFFNNHPEFDVCEIDTSELTPEQVLQKAVAFINQ